MVDGFHLKTTHELGVEPILGAGSAIKPKLYI
jgi:hypothetical protein